MSPLSSREKLLNGIIVVLVVVVVVMATSIFIPKTAKTTAIRVSMAKSVTVYETTGELSAAWTFSVDSIMAGVAHFNPWEEDYYITSDGTNLTITCYRMPEGGTRFSVGNNVNAVRLNGVEGYHHGVWATRIQSVSSGLNGIPESAANALGPDTQIGPYLDSPCTYLGDGYSSITLGFVAS